MVLGFFVETVKRTLFQAVKNLEIKHISLPSPYKIISEIWMKYVFWLIINTYKTVRQTKFGNHWSSSIFPQYQCFSLRKRSFENRLFASIFYWTRAGSFATLVTTYLTDGLTNYCLLDLIGVTLASEDDNLKLAKLSTDFSATVMAVWCRFGCGHKVRFLFRLQAQGFKVCLRFWSWCPGKILKLKFGHYFAADAWLWSWSSNLVEILNRFGQDLKV